MTLFRAFLAALLALNLSISPATLWAQESAQDATATTVAGTTIPASVEGDEGAAAAIDYGDWERVAQRAEQAVEAGRASDQALTNLRAELDQWRVKFTDAKAENQVRITTLQTQIATLGPAPAEGETEPAILTQKRAELTGKLVQAQAPAKDAELARARANALIGEIDSLLRTRQTDALTRLGPTPLNPVLWREAFDDLSQTLSLAWSGVVSSLGTETQRSEFTSNIPVLLLFVIIAFTLLLRGRRWVMQAGRKVRKHARGPARGVLDFVVSFGQIIAPLIGVFALVEALNYAGILGLRAQVIVDELPMLGLSIFVARWLGNRLFGPPDNIGGVLNLPAATRREGRGEVNLLGVVYGLSLMLSAIATYESYPASTVAVLNFPILVTVGVLLLRLGQILRRHAKAETEDADDGTRFMIRTQGFAGWAMIIVGVVGVSAAAIGYGALAEAFLFPTAQTAGLAGFLIVLHRFFLDLYGVVTGGDDEASQNALLPVLASFVVSLALLPVLMLIWGMRVTDLTEIWTRISEGITIGDTVVSPSNLLTFAVVFAVGFALTRLTQGMLTTTVLPKTKLDTGGQSAISSGIGYLGIFLAVIASVTAAGIDLSSLAIVAGALSVGIGFGLQNIISNFVSGIILLIERPISEGDWIEVGGEMGFVRDISVRSTRIETFDRTDVILPNSELISGVVTNYTRQNLMGRVIVPVGVAYGTDSMKVETILKEIANAHPLVALNPPPSVFFMEFGADSMNFEIRAILRDVNFKLSVRSEMNHEIARRFAEEGIEIPFAQRDIWLRNPEALTGRPAVAPVEPDAEPDPEPVTVETDPEQARAMLDPAAMRGASSNNGEGDGGE
ncbi:MAG: DUF3772 domain-containing protein [Maritimibacter sp.]